MYILNQHWEMPKSSFSARDKLIMVVSNADIKCSNMASRLLASRTSSAGGAAASTTNQTITSRTISPVGPQQYQPEHQIILYLLVL